MGETSEAKTLHVYVPPAGSERSVEHDENVFSFRCVDVVWRCHTLKVFKDHFLYSCFILEHAQLY